MPVLSSVAPERKTLSISPCLFVFESNVKVLNYLKRTFSGIYDLRLFSDEQSFLRDLDTVRRPSLVVQAWDGIAALPASVCPPPQDPP